MSSKEHLKVVDSDDEPETFNLELIQKWTGKRKKTTEKVPRDVELCIRSLKQIPSSLMRLVPSQSLPVAAFLHFPIPNIPGAVVCASRTSWVRRSTAHLAVTSCVASIGCSSRWGNAKNRSSQCIDNTCIHSRAARNLFLIISPRPEVQVG